ncbi:DnaK family protein [Toxoplasma gondii VAND]|uniref:DnaK family protein n=1 Tax=Toxoplasma gondii VAND TaxID=933077 RepID=A0A086QKD7_TOXGO|nr:DnaK family protein [Toxoplasma gondii VAND]
MALPAFEGVSPCVGGDRRVSPSGSSVRFSSHSSRLGCFFFAFCFLSVSLFSPLGAKAQVVGLDLGSEFVKVALVAAGRPIEILLNPASKRKTNNAVSFADEEKRELGDEGAAQAAKKPDRVFLHPNLLLGVNATDFGLVDVTADPDSAFLPLALKEKLLPSGYPHDYYPYRLFMDRRRHSVAVLAKDGVYLPAELLTASMLAFVKKLATQAAGVDNEKTLGCVISVPCRYTQRQRQALRDAVEIAGMHAVAFHHHSVTAAVQHALDLPTNTTATKLFYDVGSSTIDVGVVRFAPVQLPSKKEVLQVQLLACESMSGAGGHHVDLAIAEKMRGAFERRYGAGKSLLGVPRALKKLVKQAVMAKHVLSANKQTQFRVEGLHNDVDFNEPFERMHLEALLEEKGMLAKLKASLDATLSHAGLDLNDVDQVELLGGASRVPRVQQELGALMGAKDVGTHLNGDEAMATGAAFIAANSTATFRVKQLLLQDITPYEYLVKIDAVAEEDDPDAGVRQGDRVEKTKVLVGRHTRFAQGSRTVSLRTTHDFQVELFEDDASLLKLAVTGVAEAAKKLEEEAQKKAEAESKTEKNGEGESETPEKRLPKANLVFKVDGAGVLSFDRAYLTQDYFVYVPLPSTTTKATTTKESEGEETSTTTPAPAAKFKRLTKQVSDALAVEETQTLPLPLTSEERNALRKQLQEMEAADLRVHKLAEAMNRLEASIYAARGLLAEETVERVSLPETREELRKQLEADEEWIYDSAKAEGIEAVKKKLVALESVVEPMKKRAEELEARPKAIEKMEKALVDLVSRLEQIATKRPWVSEEKLASVRAFGQDVDAWWREKLASQQSKLDTEDPVFTKAEVLAKVKELGAAVKALENIPRPTTTTTTSPGEGKEPGEQKQEEKIEEKKQEEKKEEEKNEEKKEEEKNEEKKEEEKNEEKKEEEKTEEKKEEKVEEEHKNREEL